MDLFSTRYGNEDFLLDLVDGVPLPAIRAKIDAAAAANTLRLHRPSIRGWMAMAGRTM